MAREKKVVEEKVVEEDVKAEEVADKDEFVQLDELTRVRKGVEDPDPKSV